MPAVRRGLALTERARFGAIFGMTGPGTSGVATGGAWDFVNQRSINGSSQPFVTASERGGAGRSPGGRSWQFGTEGSAGVLAPTGPCTVAFLERRDDTTIRDSAFWGPSLTTANRMNLSTFTDNNIHWDYGGVSGANRISVSVTGNITTALTAWVAVAGLRGSAIYRNGLRLAGQTTAITRSASTGAFRVSGQGATESPDPRTVLLFLVLAQEWTPTQVREWTTAPFSVLDPGPARYASLFAAAPPPSAIQVGAPGWRGAWRGLNRGAA